MCKPGTNVGGSSQISEAFSYELFARWGFTELEKTEKEIYNLLKPIGKIAIDYVCKINDVSVEVSVTRAMNNNNSYRGCFAEKDVIKLLTDKLNDLKDATKYQNNLLWEKQILYVWVQNENTANIVSHVASKLLKDHKSNTLVVISKAEESDFIFTNDFTLLLEMAGIGPFTRCHIGTGNEPCCKTFRFLSLIYLVLYTYLQKSV